MVINSLLAGITALEHQSHVRHGSYFISFQVARTTLGLPVPGCAKNLDKHHEISFPAKGKTVVFR